MQKVMETFLKKDNKFMLFIEEHSRMVHNLIPIKVEIALSNLLLDKDKL
jgi:hypothetical protein